MSDADIRISEEARDRLAALGGVRNVGWEPEL